MADVETPAAPSPAEATPESSPQQQGPVSVPTNAADYAKWRETGKLPEKPSSGDSAPPKKTPVTPDSEPGAHKRQGADSRKQELNTEIRDLIAQRDRLKQEVQAPPEKKDVARESSSPQPEAPKAPARPVKPKQDDFKTWDEFETAKDKYDEDLADWKANQAIDAYVQRTQQAAQTREMQVKLDDAKTRYGEEAEPKIVDTAKTVFNNQQVAPAIKAALGRSQVLVDALYVMGSDPKELQSFIDLSINDPLEALRKWHTVEALVKIELGKGTKEDKAIVAAAELDAPAAAPANGVPARDEEGKFVSSKAPPARIQRQAPAPPTELGGNSSPPGDPRDRAAANGDVRTFFTEGNRRDMARWKGQT